MSMKINVVIDTSGSMAEEDKNAVIKYVLNTICGLDLGNVEFSFFQLGTQTKKLENITKEKLMFGGAFRGSAIDELKAILENEAPIILLSDGNIETDIKSKLFSIENDIIPVWIGMDANIACLEAIAKDKRVYSVPDVMQAVNSIF